MRLLLFILTLLLSAPVLAQNRIPTLSQDAEISLLTIGPGPELYDSFGHTALRVQDTKQRIDIVFNYGLFDFDTPNFYTKFARGKLLYRLAFEPFDNFLSKYIVQQRSVTSQTLLQNTEERQALFAFLLDNAKEENSHYLYDFLYDNCATRPANAINKVYSGDLFANYIPEKPGLTHRQLIQKNVPWNTWGSFGMDVAIGSVVDRPVSNKEYLFLPEYTMEALSIAEGPNAPLAGEAQALFTPETPNVYTENWVTSPLVVFSAIAILLLFLTYQDRKNNKGIRGLDKIILVVTGVVGVLLALLWFATDHAPTKWNYNLLWAFPFHLLAAISLKKIANKKWLYPYLKLTIILLVLLAFHWIIGVQKYPAALLPLLLALAIRYLYLLGEVKKTIPGD